MTPVTIIGIIAACLLFVPVFIIAACRLYGNRSLLVLALYYLFAAVYALMSESVIPISDNALQLVGVINNYCDVPMMLVVLLLFCTTRARKKMVYISLAAYVAYEAVIFAFHGVEAISVIYIMGVGLLLMLGYSMYYFGEYVKLSLVKSKALGKTLMIASIIFAYGCYGMIYFIYYIQKTSAVADVFIIYYLVSIISSILMSIGLTLVYRRTRQIQEVQRTRRELALFFNH